MATGTLDPAFTHHFTDRIENRLYNYLDDMGSGYMSPSAYDTAWIARLGSLAPDLSVAALDWLRAQQLDDGSWGTSELVYHHERLICTLSAINVLAMYGSDGDRDRIARGRATLKRWIDGLSDDGAGATIGFELIIPTLLEEAEALGVLPRHPDALLYEMAARRTIKLAALPEGMVNRNVTVAFSSEMFGTEAVALLDKENLQEDNGSVAYSPAATAYFALYVDPGNLAALDYLRRVVSDGSAPNNTPIDVFEAGWGLWNLALAVDLDDRLIPLCQPHLELLSKSWNPDYGVGACSGFSLVDGDDTGIVYEMLMRFGWDADLDAVLRYETDTHFRCFPLESDPSISTNIHILGALRAAGMDDNHPSVRKVIDFLRQTRSEERYWFDKWHASPYYPTAHGIINCATYDPAMAADAVEWILENQNRDGSWGFFMPTAEETAYCIQALMFWQRLGYTVALESIERAQGWLRDHIDPPYPKLWIGKSLYCPEQVVYGTILSALMMV